MSISLLLLKLAASAGIATVSEIVGSDNHSTKEALNKVLGSVAGGFLQQHASQINYEDLAGFITNEAGGGYRELNHDIAKLMLASVPKTFKLLEQSYQQEFETDKGVLAFFKLLEEQAAAKPVDRSDYDTMEADKALWLEGSTSYAWQFAEMFIADSDYNADELFLDHIKSYLTEHFDSAFEVVFLEGLKDDKNERPLKAFTIKMLNGLQAQSERLLAGQSDILRAIEQINSNIASLGGIRGHYQELAVGKRIVFEKRVLTYLRRIDFGVVEANKKLDKILEGTKSEPFPHLLTVSPPKININQYVERGNILEKIREDLLAGNKALLLNGLGGMGKSTIAARYVDKYGHEYDHLAWMTQTDTFENMLLAAHTLQSNLGISTEGKEVAQIQDEIFNNLNKVPNRKLLVLDNVEQDLTLFTKKLPYDWHILLTSRQTIGGAFTIHHIDKLNFEEAKALILLHCTKAHNTSDADLFALCEQVGYHALTLELLAKTLQESFELNTVAELTTYLAQNKLDAAELQELVHTGHSDAEVEAYAHLTQTFSLAKLSENEKWVLLQFAVLPAYEHNYQDLKEWLQIDNKSWFAETIKSLCKKGWISKTDNKLQIHRMIQTLVKFQERPDADNTKELVVTFTEKLSLDQSKDNPIDKFIWVEYGKFLVDNNDFEVKEVLESSVAVLANNLALVLKDLGEYGAAKTYLEKALESAEKNFGKDHPTTAIRYSNLALVLKDLGEYGAAKTYLEKALESAEKNFGKDHPTTAIRYSNLALVLQDLGEYGAAKTYLEKALESAEKNFGKYHPTTAISYSNLALVLQDLGEYGAAKTYLEKALESAEKNFGKYHPTTAISYSNLALVLKDLGEYGAAKTYLEKALESAEKNFGKDHPTTAIRYSNLALVLKDLGEYGAAKTYLEKALESAEKNFGKDHPTTAIRYSNLALVLKDLGEYGAAKTYLEKALESAEKNFGKDHPTTAIRYSNLALVLQDLGEYGAAKTYLEKALESAEKNFGKYHPTTAISYSNLALVLQDLGEYGAAKTYLEKALESDEKNFGKYRPTTAIRYSSLATVLQDLGEYGAAKTYLEKALESDEKNFGKDHPTTARSYSNLALVLQDLGEYGAAKTYLEKALESDEKNFGKYRPTTAIRYSSLATVLQDLGEYGAAKTYLEKALESDEKNFGKDHPTTAIRYHNYASLLFAMEHPCEAVTYSEKAWKVFHTIFGDSHPNTQLVLENLELFKKRCAEKG